MTNLLDNRNIKNYSILMSVRVCKKLKFYNSCEKLICPVTGPACTRYLINFGNPKIKS